MLDELCDKLENARYLAADMLLAGRPKLSAWLSKAVVEPKLASGRLYSITVINGLTRVGGFTKTPDTGTDFDWIARADTATIAESLANWTTDAHDAKLFEPA